MSAHNRKAYYKKYNATKRKETPSYITRQAEYREQSFERKKEYYESMGWSPLAVYEDDNFSNED